MRDILIAVLGGVIGYLALRDRAWRAAAWKIIRQCLCHHLYVVTISGPSTVYQRASFYRARCEKCGNEVAGIVPW